jgi:phosphate transport system ATP-binding protein
MTEPQRRVEAPEEQLSVAIATQARGHHVSTAREKVFELKDLSVHYGANPAVKHISLDVYKNNITALIGPSGCGKSTLIRCLNRMNDLIPSARVEGQLLYHGEDLYGPKVDPVQVRKLIGMVFQKPNPFPKSIYDNIAFGPRTLGFKGEMDERVERALRGAALWDEVKDRLQDNAYGLSGGQQQRLCIARCIAVEPDTILMDEPCSALDPISTGKIEDLMIQLKADYSIVIVTHNMQQAARVSDRTAFLIVELTEDEQNRWGEIVEYDETEKIFTNPADKRTEDYVTGKVG